MCFFLFPGLYIMQRIGECRFSIQFRPGTKYERKIRRYFGGFQKTDPHRNHRDARTGTMAIATTTSNRHGEHDGLRCVAGVPGTGAPGHTLS